jgi:methylglutamate dehydrogenase subunit B
MRIPCPFCGERDLSEFQYAGDARAVRPDSRAQDAEVRFVEYVYVRDNPSGAHAEIWQHRHGCRSWIVVTRDTMTHAIEAARFVADRDEPAVEAGAPLRASLE